MKTLYSFIIALSLLTVIACKSKQPVAAASAEKKPQPSPASSVPATPVPVSDKAMVYRVIVSCTSIGAGGDSRVMKDLEDYVKSYGEKGAYEMVRWGREGERDYCFKLDKLSASEQQAFVAKLRAIIADSKLAYLKENSVCEHKR